MNKMKRVMIVIFSFLFVTTLVQLPITTKAEDETIDDVYIKIRYNRQDKDYEGWNFWVWEDGKDAKRFDFIGQDDEGKFIVVKTSKAAKSLGFILRKSVEGNDFSENYFGTDKFIDLSVGDKEIVINHNDGLRDFITQDINRGFEKMILNIHYFRFDNNFDKWDIWCWLDSTVKDKPIKGGEAHPFKSEDEYGKIATIEVPSVINTADRGIDKRGIGIIVRKEDWAAKDVEFDRFINLAYANNKGEINAYLVQNNQDIVFRAEDTVKDAAITSAKIDAIREITFSTNVKLPSKDTKVIVKENGKPIEIEKQTISNNLVWGSLSTKADLDLTKEYSIEVDGFKATSVTLGKIFTSKEFENIFHYSGKLGADYSNNKTSFILWAPVASEVKVALFEAGNGGSAKEVKPMAKGEKGIWTLEVSGDLAGTYYTYLVTNNGVENEVTDPYAKAVGVNGDRAMVIDMESTNPEGWSKDKKPEFKNPTDAVIYELHIRDFTIDESAGTTMEVRGKYNGVWQAGTSLLGKGDIKTGVEHLKELGITHLHLLPTFDYRSIDETNLDKPQFNWGYDPQNYNVPEGSYSSDPYKAEIRIKEFKQMVLELHKAGIRVVMDVVYNHTGASADSHLNLTVPNYYYRENLDGKLSNGSGCGNETASERSMVRKMIVDSVVYWAKEYHIDGFRFDLMALHDIDTMKEVRKELDKVDKTILLYGEGWTGGATPLPSEERSLKANISKFGDLQIAAFSDDMRDGIKGHVFHNEWAGFVNGYKGLEEQIKFGIVASTKHKGITYGTSPEDYKGYAVAPWANEPYQTINYASAHDNLTLWDKLQTTNPKASKEELIAMNKMAAALVFTSQGIPFFQAGEEMARTKVNEDGTFNHNSYNAPDSVNHIDWSRKEDYSDLYNYYKGLIELRKSHNAFKMDNTKQIQGALTFLEKGISFKEDNVVAYIINGKKAKDWWKSIAVLFNANDKEVEVTLPSEGWTVVVNEKTAGTEKLATVDGDKVLVPAHASYVLVDTKSFTKDGTTIAYMIIGALAIVAVGAKIYVRSKNKK